MAKYCDKRGLVIREREWRELQEDYNYTFLGEYENDRQRVECVWVGRVESNAHEMFWQPFAVIIWLKVGEKWNEHPEMHKFSDHIDALDFYKHYLIKNTDCFLDEDERFIEVDNLAAKRRMELIAEAAVKTAEKERKAPEIAQAKKVVIDLDALIAEKVRKEKEEADDIRMLAELEELAVMETRGGQYGGW